MLQIPDSSEKLAQSNVVVSSASLWPKVIDSLQKQVHQADFWRSQEPEKPLSLAEVRKLHYFALQTPMGGQKLAVLEGVENFKAETTNSLLKLLEEPPSFLTIILFSETPHILPTLKSRLRLLSLPGNSATIGQDVTRDVFQSYDLSDAKQRARATNLLHQHALLHSTIKPEILKSLK